MTHDIQDQSNVARLREILSAEGFQALHRKYSGIILYVNSKNDPTQFIRIMSEEDAQTLVHEFAGADLYIPMFQSNKRLIIAYAFMHGFRTPDLAKALQCTQGYVFKCLRTFQTEYPALKTFAYVRKNRNSIPDEFKGSAWDYPNFRIACLPQFLVELREHPVLSVKLDDLNRDMEELQDRLPDDPCTSLNAAN